MADDSERVEGKRLGEFDIIAKYFAPLATDTASLGLRDDVAVFRPIEGQEIVLSCDTIVEGVHFLKDDPPESIGHKALAVNLSDLAAKGARPYLYLLSLSLPPRPSPAWLEAFASGLQDLQESAGAALVGGDTSSTPGPLSVTIAALGVVPHGHAVLRHGAKDGDRLYVSGTIGDGYLGLRILKEPALARSWGFTGEEKAFVIDRYRRPQPRNDLMLLIRNFATAAIDVSDGLVGDVEKLAGVSHVGALIEASRVPFSEPARKALEREPKLLEALITSGDDYEILAAVPDASSCSFDSEARGKGTGVTRIGRIEGRPGSVMVLGADGQTLKLGRKGFTHF
jgi:thiamine-monophosphate kinase